jgi:predicted nuclease of restriction endonuclease-like (RecB) superfamily
MSASKMNYKTLLRAISQAHQQAQAGAAGTVNRYLVLRNWLIGAYVVEYQQKGSDRALYGEGLLRRLAEDLQQKGVGGTSPDMLERMRLFYATYPQARALISAPPARKSDHALRDNKGNQAQPRSAISAPPARKSATRIPPSLEPEDIAQFSWTHLAELVRIEDPWKRAFYENECLKGNWSKRQLQRQIGSLLYERTGLSTDKRAVIKSGREDAAKAPLTMAELIRDPYVLEFTGLAEQSRYHESTLEAALLNHLQSFLLELGNGFCFEARQKRVTVGNEHDYLDLDFYHRVLRCHLLIDLKVRAFRHGDAGQMNFYLNFWKDQMMTEGDQPPVGLLLCADKDRTKVEYATAGMDRKLFVSRYLIALPKPGRIKHLIETDRAAWEQGRRSGGDK